MHHVSGDLGEAGFVAVLLWRCSLKASLQTRMNWAASHQSEQYVARVSLQGRNSKCGSFRHSR
eukprot:3860769-Amphidinium_carterae.1